MKKIKDSNRSRSKYISAVIQPKIDTENWLNCDSDKIFNYLLLSSSFPLYTEIQYAIENIEALTTSTLKIIKPKVWAFGRETSSDTKIPHYQIYLGFDKLIKNSSVYQSLNRLLEHRVHIGTKKSV